MVSSIIKTAVAKTVLKTLKSTLDLTLTNKSSIGLSSEWVASDDWRTKSEIYQLRHRVLIETPKSHPYPPGHECLKVCPHTSALEFRDPLDDFESTSHVLLRFNGFPIASTRICDGNQNPITAEHYGWVPDLRDIVKPHLNNSNNIAEPARVVACKSVRGTNVVPLMYLHCLSNFVDNDIEGFVGFVDDKARKLTEHYTKWAKVQWLSDPLNPVSAGSYLEGRSYQWCLANVGTAGSKEREDFLIYNAGPAMAAVKLQKEPKIPKEEGKLAA